MTPLSPSNLLPLFAKLSHVVFLVERERVKAAFEFSSPEAAAFLRAQWQEVIARTTTYQSVLEHLHELVLRDSNNRLSLVVNDLLTSLHFEERCFDPNFAKKDHQQWVDAWPLRMQRTLNEIEVLSHPAPQTETPSANYYDYVNERQGATLPTSSEPSSRSWSSQAPNEEDRSAARDQQDHSRESSIRERRASHDRSSSRHAQERSSRHHSLTLSSRGHSLDRSSRRPSQDPSSRSSEHQSSRSRSPERHEKEEDVLDLTIVNAHTGCSLQFKLKKSASFSPALEAFTSKYRKLVKDVPEALTFQFRKQLVHKNHTPDSFGIQNRDEILAFAVQKNLQLCSFALRGESCRNSEHDACTFAHSVSEIDFERRAGQFKKRLCRARNCRLGGHCLFAHGNDEVRSNLAFPMGPVSRYFRDPARPTLFEPPTKKELVDFVIAEMRKAAPTITVVTEQVATVVNLEFGIPLLGMTATEFFGKDRRVKAEIDGKGQEAFSIRVGE